MRYLYNRVTTIPCDNMIKQPCEFFEHPNDTYYHPYEVHPYQTGDQPCECIRVVLKNIRVRFVRVRTQFNFRLTHIDTRVRYIRVRQVNNRVNASVWYDKSSVSGSSV